MKHNASDPRDWARAILDKIEKGIRVHPIAAESALEALVGHPRHREPGQATAEVIPFPRPETAAAVLLELAAEPAKPADELPVWEGPVDDYWWNEDD